MEKTFTVPQDMWDTFVEAATKNREQQLLIRSTWEAIADKAGFIMPTMQVIDEEKRLITGEARPDPAMVASRKILGLVDAMQDLTPEEKAKVSELANKPAVRKLQDQVKKLEEDGWTLDAAYGLSDSDDKNGVYPGKLVLVEEFDA